MSETTELLKSCYLFSDLPDKLLEKVSERMTTETFQPREVIFREGQEGDTLFIIRKGSVEIRKKDRQSGIEFHLTKLDAPAAFGEIALLKSGPRTATVVSLTDTEVLMLKGVDFDNMTSKLPEFALSVARGLASRVDALSQGKGVSYGQLSQQNYDPKVLGLLPKKTLAKLKILPLAFNGTSLSVAMVDPHDMTTFEQMRALVPGVVIEPLVVSEIDYKRFMDTHYDRAIGSLNKKSESSQSAGSVMDISGLMDELDADMRELVSHDESAMAKLGRDLLVQAVRRNASELHLEPRSDKLVVRLRINGRLETAAELNRATQGALIKRFKHMADIDLEQTSQSQHGSIQISEDGIDVSFPVDTLPTRYGEKIVVNMPESGSIPALEHLMLNAADRQDISSLLTVPDGLVLLLGPSGSGKTTTLYSLLRQMLEKDLNAYALGHRVAYELDRVNRVELSAGMDMSSAFRSVLRQHPDVILLEELTDAPTIQLAMDAALTGHLVMSAFAATNLDSALMRYQLMGGDREMLIDALAATVTQRLVRKLCPNCREAYTPEPAVLKRLGLPSETVLYRPAGCSVCHNSGYRGRVGIYETMLFDGAQRDMLLRGTKLQGIYGGGQRSLRDSGIDLLRSGQTTPTELLRALRI